MTTIEKARRPRYHEFEFSFCGFSGSGKTTLIEKLFKLFSESYSVGYVKSDAHFFEMDRKGKDTARMSESGAQGVHIYDKTHAATIQQGDVDLLQRRQLFYNKDFVLVEGRKKDSISKALLIDTEMEILKLYESGEIDEVRLLIGPWESNPSDHTDIPYIQRDQVEAISDFILNHFEEKVLNKPIFGLVLSGGRSHRMKQDKAMLSYDGKPQLLSAAELIEPYCEQVYLSYRADQGQRQQFMDYPSILDRFIDFGPMGGILSAQSEFEDATWLVLACDLPFLDRDSVSYLLEQRNPFKVATAFRSVNDGLPEPLCAVYESRSRQQLLSYLGIGYRCPRKVLLNSNVEVLDPINSRALENVNHPHEYKFALQELGSQQEQV